MFCGQCGANILDTARFCRYCGTPVPVPTVKKCPDCGAEYDDDAVFCDNCGTPLKDMPPDEYLKQTIPGVKSVHVLWFPGTKVLGAKLAEGTLSIYENRLEFIADGEGPQANPSNIYMFSDITDVSLSVFLDTGIDKSFHSMDITLRDGWKRKFAPTDIPVNECIKLIKEHI